MESKTENRINECISHLDITYSYQLAKQMETHKTNPVLGFRTAGSDAEHKTGDFLYEEMKRIGLQNVTKDEFWLDSWTFDVLCSASRTTWRTAYLSDGCLSDEF